jgi:alkylation response protein AidB-like acyl-CoA dehydrogenase
LAHAAQLLGLGRWLLDSAVSYAKQRKQFGREIGQFQAIKHLLAEVVTELELARPLVFAAAVALAEPGGGNAARDVSAARVAAADAAYLAARVSLQVHGAIGYTAEHDVGLWLTKVRALMTTWGTQTYHRARVAGSWKDAT